LIGIPALTPHHGRGVDIGHRAGRVGGQLRHRRRAAAFEDFDIEAGLLVESLVERHEERRMLAIQRPVQAKRKLVERLCASRRRQRHGCGRRHQR
jgi:hypothetical protein